MKMVPSLTHTHVIPILFDFLSSVLWSIFNGSQWSAKLFGYHHLLCHTGYTNKNIDRTHLNGESRIIFDWFFETNCQIKQIGLRSFRSVLPSFSMLHAVSNLCVSLLALWVMCPSGAAV